MKKYFGAKQEWSLDELKNIVSKNPTLRFQLSYIISKTDGTVTIQNRNRSVTFEQLENKNWTKK